MHSKFVAGLLSMHAPIRDKLYTRHSKGCIMNAVATMHTSYTHPVIDFDPTSQIDVVCCQALYLLALDCRYDKQPGRSERQ